MQSGGHLLEQVPALMSRPSHCCHTGTVFSCMLCIYRYICCFILICFFILLLCCQNIFDLIWFDWNVGGYRRSCVCQSSVLSWTWRLSGPSAWRVGALICRSPANRRSLSSTRHSRGRPPRRSSSRYSVDPHASCAHCFNWVLNPAVRQSLVNSSNIEKYLISRIKSRDIRLGKIIRLQPVTCS